MIKAQKYKTPLYGNGFTLIVYEHSSELIESVPDYDFDKQSVADLDGCVFIHNDITYIAFRWVVIGGVQYPTPGIIAHESKHLTNNIFIDINHRLDLWNDEPECYLLQWIVDTVHDFINKHYTESIIKNKV